MNNHSDANDTCDKILVILDRLETFNANPDNTAAAITTKPDDRSKALFRKGQSLLGLSRPEEAIAVLQQAKSLLPNDGMILKTITAAERVIQQREAKEKKMYQKMFS